MKKIYLMLVLLVSCATPALAGEEDADLKKLISICLANPEFKPSSIDNHDPDSASELEKEYYSIAQKLHKEGALGYVIQKRKEASDQRMVNCIQGVLETWPG